MSVPKRVREQENTSPRPTKKARKSTELDSVQKPAVKAAKTTKSKTAVAQDAPVKRKSLLVADEVDFPRGGGTILTPLEYKEAQVEAAKEVKEELFKDSLKRKRRLSSKHDGKNVEPRKTEMTGVRVEHLNYKRLQIGTRLLCRVAAVYPLHLVLSLPNQLAGYVPITHVSAQLTAALEREEIAVDRSAEDDSDGEDEDSDEEQGHSGPPELATMFTVGQYVRASVTAIRSPGARATGPLDLGKPRNEQEAMSRRVELSLVPGVVNEGLAVKDVVAGFALSGAIQSVEDHGYVVDIGLPSLSGFMPWENAPGGETKRLKVGHLLSCTAVSISENGRVCTVTTKSDPAKDLVTEASSVTSVLPGTLVRALVTAVVSSGLNLQVLGFFDGTIDLYHLPNEVSTFKVGSKIKARVLWDSLGSSPPKFALSALPHIVSLSPPRIGGKNGEVIQDKYTFGMLVQDAKVIRVDPEWGVTCELSDGARGFVHISHIADDRVPALSAASGAWKVGTVHSARVLGFYSLDGLLQLSFKPSAIERKYLQSGDLQVGQIIKGTVQNLKDVGLFVDVGGNVNGRVRPEHYADIMLKHPEKKFKAGTTVKCRILSINTEHNKLNLTLKKSLLNSELPILSSVNDAKVGQIADAAIFKVMSAGVLVEFYAGVKGFVPLKEASESFVKSAEDVFTVGQAVKVKILSVTADDGHILASVRQALPTYKSLKDDLSSITIGDTVEAEVKEIQTVNVVLSLRPGGQTALASVANLVNNRGHDGVDIWTNLTAGSVVSDLIVVSKNPEKGLVIVSARPSGKPSQPLSGGVSFKNLRVGQILPGRVVSAPTPAGVSIRLSHNVTGRLHPLDMTDDLGNGIHLPAIESIVKVAVVGFDGNKRTVDLSTRPSRLVPNEHPPILDREINTIEDLEIGQDIRGSVKNISDSGLYIALGRNVTARVLIKNLFDEFVKDWQPRFSIHQVVKGKVTQVNPTTKQVEMTLRSGAVSAKDRLPAKSTEKLKGLRNFSEGEKVSGTVSGVAEFGVFIRIDGSNVGGLCHHSELSDTQEGDVRTALKGFRVGDSVKAVILSINSETRKISFGLKPSYFTSEDYEMEDLARVSATDDAVVTDEEEVNEELEEGEQVEAPEEEDEEAGSEDDSEDDIIIVNEARPNAEVDSPSKSMGSKPALPAPPLKLPSAFQWFVAAEEPEVETGSSGTEDELDAAPPTKTKKSKRKGAHIEQDLTLEMQERAPESVTDFERVLLGSPNSSFLWIQFMSFQLQLSEVDKAREIARRALKVINFREEQERMNVWIALLNLENAAGTDESLEAVFQEASKANDAKTMHLRMAAIFDESGKPEKAVEIYKRTAKKFSHSSKVWVLFGRHYLEQGKLEEARDLLPRSLKSLEKRKHIKTIQKFAQLEYELGDPERGKTLFEVMVDSHPKRLDLWFVYVDMEAKQGDLQAVRKLFDRLLSMRLNTFKAKSCFKKWLEVEKRIGDEDGQEHVKSRAVEWTQRNATDP